jgi:hypothetical protein
MWGRESSQKEENFLDPDRSVDGHGVLRASNHLCGYKDGIITIVGLDIQLCAQLQILMGTSTLKFMKPS